MEGRGWVFYGAEYLLRAKEALFLNIFLFLVTLKIKKYSIILSPTHITCR
jgi:hypothetical protein